MLDYFQFILFYWLFPEESDEFSRSMELFFSKNSHLKLLLASGLYLWKTWFCLATLQRKTEKNIKNKIKHFHYFIIINSISSIPEMDSSWPLALKSLAFWTSLLSTSMYLTDSPFSKNVWSFGALRIWAYSVEVELAVLCRVFSKLGILNVSPVNLPNESSA